MSTPVSIADVAATTEESSTTIRSGGMPLAMSMTRTACAQAMPVGAGFQRTALPAARACKAWAPARKSGVVGGRDQQDDAERYTLHLDIDAPAARRAGSGRTPRWVLRVKAASRSRKRHASASGRTSATRVSASPPAQAAGGFGRDRGGELTRTGGQLIAEAAQHA